MIFSSVRFKALYHTQESQSIDRVLGFFSSRPNLDPPTPSPAGECIPPPPLVVGETHSLEGEGVGGPNPDEGQTLWYSRYTVYVLCAVFNMHILLLKVLNFERLRYFRVTKYNIFKRWMLVS